MQENKNHYEFIVLGAGIAGLGAGVALRTAGKDSIILEKDSDPGGLNKNTSLYGCDFDYGPKILLLDDSEYKEEILSFLEGNYEQYPVVERTYLSKYGLLGFPLQRYLVDISEAERKKIINDLERTRKSPKRIKSYRDWLINNFGEYFCNLVLFPYEEKKWQVDLAKMDYKWALGRPVKVDYNEVVEGSKRRLSPNKSYYYPKKGNISTLTNAMAKAAVPIFTNTEVLSINIKKKYIDTNKGRYYYKYLISSLPLDSIAQITDGLPKSLKIKGNEKLKRLSILVYNLVFDGRHELDGTAIYYPEKKYIFRRVSVLQNLCPALSRENLTPISVELSVKNTNISKEKSKEYLRKIIADFKEVDGLKDLGKPIAWDMLKVEFAYPLQLNGLRETVDEIHSFYNKYDVYHCGRGGSFDYCNSDVAYKQGKETVLKVLQMIG